MRKSQQKARLQVLISYSPRSCSIVPILLFLPDLQKCKQLMFLCKWFACLYCHDSHQHKFRCSEKRTYSGGWVITIWIVCWKGRTALLSGPEFSLVSWRGFNPYKSIFFFNRDSGATVAVAAFVHSTAQKCQKAWRRPFYTILSPTKFSF